MLRDGVGTVGGDVGHRDAALSRRVEVNYVHAGGEDPDVFEGGLNSEDRVDVEGGLVGQDRPCVTDPVENLLRRGTVMDLYVTERAQIVPGEVAWVEGVAVKYDDLHLNQHRE